MLPRRSKAHDKSRRLLDASALREPAFVLSSLGSFFFFLAYFVPFFYIVSLAQIVDGVADDITFNILAIVNVGNFFGRIIPGYIADKGGALPTLMFVALVLDAMLLTWIAANSLAGTVVWAIPFGFIARTSVSVPAAVLSHLCPAMDVIGSRLAMSWAGAAVGVLIGNPIAAVVTDCHLRHFWHAQVFAGVVMLCGIVVDLVPLRYIKPRSRERLVGEHSEDE